MQQYIFPKCDKQEEYSQVAVSATTAVQGPKYYCKGQNITARAKILLLSARAKLLLQGPKYSRAKILLLSACRPSIKNRNSKWKQSQPQKNEFQMEIAKSYQPPSEIVTLHFCRLVLKFAGSRECYYRGVRWSGNSLCASSKYGVTLMCM